MHTPTIFDINFKSEKMEYLIPQEKLHHLQNVLRIKNNSYIRITNGKGLISLGKIMDSHIIIEENKTHQRTNDVNIFISKLQNKSRIRYLIEKLTELGVTAITVGKTDNSQKVNIDPRKVNNWIIGAVEQSGIPFTPNISIGEQLDFDKFQHTFDITGENFKKNIKVKSFAIGPEGGWSKKELENFKYISKLSNFTLRSDTAAIVAVSLMM